VNRSDGCPRLSGAVGPPVVLNVPSLERLHRRRSEKWVLQDPDVLSSTVAEMDFEVAEPIRAALRAAIDRSDLGYAVPKSTSLTSALARFAGRRLDWSLDPDQVTLIPDVMVGIVELCRALARPEQAIAFASPGYPPFFTELRAAGLSVRTVGLEPDGAISLDELDEVLAGDVAAFVLTSPHNPTGRVFTRAELASLAERCRERRVWVVADEIHAPLVLPGAQFVAWLEVSDAAREIGFALTSASKTFNLAALKTAFVVTAGEQTAAVAERLVGQYDHASLLGTIAAEVAFTEADAWLDALIAQLDRNRAQLGHTLAAALPAVRWTPPEATYLAWLDCSDLRLGADPARQFLDRGRVALGPGSEYGDENAQYVRLNFATSQEHLSETVRRMALAVE
jgi:cysteine-S-conjugate beta-lyase